MALTIVKVVFLVVGAIGITIGIVELIKSIRK